MPVSTTNKLVNPSFATVTHTVRLSGEFEEVGRNQHHVSCSQKTRKHGRSADWLVQILWILSHLRKIWSLLQRLKTTLAVTLSTSSENCSSVQSVLVHDAFWGIVGGDPMAERWITVSLELRRTVLCVGGAFSWLSTSHEVINQFHIFVSTRTATSATPLKPVNCTGISNFFKQPVKTSLAPTCSLLRNSFSNLHSVYPFKICKYFNQNAVCFRKLHVYKYRWRNGDTSLTPLRDIAR